MTLQDTKAPETEVPEKAQRRRFTAAYKLDVLRRVDACHQSGEIGALLRSEGLYSSHLVIWRRQREAAAAAGLSTIRRGRKSRIADARDAKIGELEKNLSRMTARAERAEALVDLQKKVSEILSIHLPDNERRS
jgi:hypothetical protein